jgi:uncharacterized damage-inducible protein DinB
MSPCEDILRYQTEHCAWANRRAPAIAQELSPDELTQDFKTSEKTILGSLVHIYRAERVWLSRIEGRPLEFRVEGDDSLEALSANWPRVSEQWNNWAKGTTEQSALAELTYQDLRRNTWTQPVWQIVLHVVNHSTHHRRQGSCGHSDILRPARIQFCSRVSDRYSARNATIGSILDARKAGT